MTWRVKIVPLAACLGAAAACPRFPTGAPSDVAVSSQKGSPGFDGTIEAHARALLDEGRRAFRYDTFGDEAFWGDRLQLHKAIAGEKLGGVGPGLTPRQALALGLKVDAAALPRVIAAAIREKKKDVNLDDPETTLTLLKANAVVGVTGFFDEKKERLVSVGIQCALCHSTVDDSLAPGIGRRLDGWPNRDLDVGRIVALAPDLTPLTTLLGVDEATAKKVLTSWGPGKYDASLLLDGKAFRPDGKSAATLLPAAFGLAGVNQSTYTGRGTVSYWNAYVANTQMHGIGTFLDARLGDAARFPVGAKAGLGELRAPPGEDRITAKLAALHFYQLSIPAPAAPEDSYDAAAAKRGRAVFEGTARCASCHVAPLFTEPGFQLHRAEEIGIDDFQAQRSPTGAYRTTPLRGLFTRAKGGFYHDGRFPTLADVVAHYERVFALSLTEAERRDLIEYLKSL